MMISKPVIGELCNNIHLNNYQPPPCIYNDIGVILSELFSDLEWERFEFLSTGGFNTSFKITDIAWCSPKEALINSFPIYRVDGKIVPRCVHDPKVPRSANCPASD